MPAQSKKQAISARIARAIQKGEVKPKAGTASAEMAKMKPSSLKHFTKTEGDGFGRGAPPGDPLATARRAMGFGDNQDEPLSVYTKKKWEPNLLKLLKAIAPFAISMQNYIDLGEEPSLINFGTLESVMGNQVAKKHPNITRMWNRLDNRAKKKLHSQLRDYLKELEILEDPQGHDYDYIKENCAGCNSNPCKCKSTQLTDIVKEMNGQPTGMTLNGKKIDTSSIEIDGIDRRDYPDFADAFISYAEYEDGTPLNNGELDKLSQAEGLWINTAVHDKQLYLEEAGLPTKGDTVMLNGKEVDLGNIKFGMQDGTPYVTSANYTDGTHINDAEYEKLEKVIDSQYDGGINKLAGLNEGSPTKGGTVMLNGKEVDTSSIEIDGIDHRDYPDFSDAYITGAEFEDGNSLTSREIEQLENEYPELVNSMIHDHQLYLEEGYDWRDDPAMSRAWEKSDVSQDEFERHKGFAKQRPVVMSFKGITFFNVPAGQDQLAYEVGLKKLKSGKWGHKHPKSGDTSSDKEILKRAEQEFGKGRYWEPSR